MSQKIYPLAPRKGIVLAGGTGTRLHPATLAVNKQLLPVYDKPMIYYPLSTLMAAGIREILIISTPEDQPRFQRLLGTGATWGLNLAYAIQPQPDGIAQAFGIGRTFIAESPVALILGDNIFHGAGFEQVLRQASARRAGATVFAYQVDDPQRYGVVVFDETGAPRALVEKPRVPPSSWAVTGLYFYDNSVVAKAANLKPSARGEYEITDLNQTYLHEGQLQVERLDRGFAWLDTGTHESLLDASAYIRMQQQRQKTLIACLEEIAFHQGWKSADDLAHAAANYGAKTGYGRHLEALSKAHTPRDLRPAERTLIVSD
jgi:glucose-1-phosphate thymidylyltransferase